MKRVYVYKNAGSKGVFGLTTKFNGKNLPDFEKGIWIRSRIINISPKHFSLSIPKNKKIYKEIDKNGKYVTMLPDSFFKASSGLTAI